MCVNKNQLAATHTQSPKTIQKEKKETQHPGCSSSNWSLSIT